MKDRGILVATYIKRFFTSEMGVILYKIDPPWINIIEWKFCFERTSSIHVYVWKQKMDLILEIGKSFWYFFSFVLNSCIFEFLFDRNRN